MGGGKSEYVTPSTTKQRPFSEEENLSTSLSPPPNKDPSRCTHPPAPGLISSSTALPTMPNAFFSPSLAHRSTSTPLSPDCRAEYTNDTSLRAYAACAVAWVPLTTATWVACNVMW